VWAMGHIFGHHTSVFGAVLATERVVYGAQESLPFVSGTD